MLMVQPSARQMNSVKPVRTHAPKIYYRPDYWQDQASCASVGIEPFFEDHGHNVAAKSVCQGCPVIMQCRVAGMLEEYGVFGGLDATDRRRIRSHVPEWQDQELAKDNGDTVRAIARDDCDMVSMLPVECHDQPVFHLPKVSVWHED